MTQQMQVATLKSGNSQLELAMAPVPSPQPGEVLVEMKASVVNEIDVQVRDGGWLDYVRHWRGRGPVVTGFEFAGIAGSDGAQIKKGDRVAGVVHVLDGQRCHAQYICVKEANAGIIPAAISFEDAVSTLGMGGAAIEIFERIATVLIGAKVLIIGASGGLGIYCVQYGQYKGVEITAICARQNGDWVRQMGASHIRAYEDSAPFMPGDDFDLIVDCPYKYSFAELKDYLAVDGMYLTSMPAHDAEGFALARTVTQRAGELLVYESTRQMVENILDHVASGNITPAIDSVFDFEDINAAFDRFNRRGKKGRILLRI